MLAVWRLGRAAARALRRTVPCGCGSALSRRKTSPRWRGCSASVGLRKSRANGSPHKRAFLFEGVMVELFLVLRDTHGLFTSFWGRTRHDWPPDTLASTAALSVASAAALTGYRSRHWAVRLDTP